MTERIAVLSDVHGNLTAYRAVLGDVAGKGPRGHEAVALTRDRCQVTARGNWDSFLGAPLESGTGDGPRWWQDELTADDRRWLAGLPGSQASRGRAG